jgi:TetR/AcrR family transcriptional regulator, repressor for uid operon
MAAIATSALVGNDVAEGKRAENPARQRVVEAAINCFARSGFHASTMQEICAEAQMSPGALYRHFPSKDSIIEAIAELERVRNREILANLDRDHTDVLEAIFDTGFAYMREVASTPAGALCAEVLVEAQRNDKIRAIFEQNNAEGRTAMRSALLRARAKGEIEPTLDLDAVTAMLMALGDGLIMRGPFEPDMSIDRIEPILRQLIRRMLAPGAAATVNDETSQKASSTHHE